VIFRQSIDAKTAQKILRQLQRNFPAATLLKEHLYSRWD
jgi:hypothetical protein